MPLSITHDYVSANGDPVDTTKIGQSKWNADHDITGTVDSSVGARELLTGDRDYYISATGSDLDDGLTPGTAWASIIHAWKTICSTLDIGGHAVTVNLGDGTYVGGFATYGDVTGVDSDYTSAYTPQGGGEIIFLGHIGSQSSVVIQSANRSDGLCFEIAHPCTSFISVRYCTLDANNNSYAAVQAYAPCLFDCTNCTFTGGDASTSCMWGLGTGCSLTMFATTINDDFESVIKTEVGAMITSGSWTLTGTSVWHTAGVVARGCGTVGIQGVMTGSATGVRYSALVNGAIDTHGGGANFIPGDSAGTLATGGQYV